MSSDHAAPSTTNRSPSRRGPSHSLGPKLRFGSTTSHRQKERPRPTFRLAIAFAESPSSPDPGHGPLRRRAPGSWPSHERVRKPASKHGFALSTPAQTAGGRKEVGDVTPTRIGDPAKAREP